MKSISIGYLAATAIAAGMLFTSAPAAAFDEEAAKALARENKCFRCHAINKDKDGPSWNSVAAKYRDKADAQERLVHHLTSGEMSKFPDGHEEEHKIIKTEPENDTAQIKNLVDWLLSL
uniref:c-type cytochrome n=1 Tax=Castellaniella defragrans TaxID=75697 RepID=UPI00333EBE1F